MTLGLTFSECFWDSDITGTFGWDTLCRRMKDGRKVCTDIAQYFKDRAKAEAEYSRALLNIARKADGKEETGLLGESWRTMKTQTESIANVHEEAAAILTSYHEELQKFNEEQKKNKTQIEENVKKHIQSKRNEYQKTMNLKKNYDDKCKEFNIADENLKTLQKSVTIKTKELEKAESKRLKCLEVRESADISYKNSVESLENIQRRWEQEMEIGCKQFEELEISRIDCLRDMLWKCSNVDSLTCLKHDECAEIVRNIMEKCDVNTDIQDFITNCQSGSKRPDPILYENYYSNKTVLSSSSSSNTLRQQALRPSRPPPSPASLTPKNPMEEDGLYASADTPTTSNTSKIIEKLIRDHKALNFKEMNIQKGNDFS